MGRRAQGALPAQWCMGGLSYRDKNEGREI